MAGRMDGVVVEHGRRSRQLSQWQVISFKNKYIAERKVGITSTSRDVFAT